MYTMSVDSLSAERKALLFAAGAVRLALRLSQIREIVSVAAGSPEVAHQGAPVPTLPVAVALGLAAGPSRYAIVTEASPPVALGVEEIHGIVELAAAEVFQLPARTLLPSPAPFQSAIVTDGDLSLELSVPTLGWAPMEPAGELQLPPPGLEFAAGREILFARAGRVYAIPIRLLVHVLERPRVFTVPLAPSAHRGLLYHGRAIHPVFDLPVLYGEPPPADACPTALLVEAGGNAIAVAADRVLPASEDPRAEVTRPAWDALFGGV